MAERLRLAEVVLVCAALVVALGPKRTRADGPQTWTVRSGDVLASVAGRFGVSVERIRKCNDLADDTIRVGQQLVVDCDVPKESSPEPTSASPEPAPTSPEPTPASSERTPAVTYEVQLGDTLSRIASRFDTTVDRLLVLNPELDPDRIREGQCIRIDDRYIVTHEVRSGDTLARLAKHHRVSIDDIVRWNPGLDRDHIRIGATLRIYSERPPSLSESIGLPYRGRLEEPVRLPRHDAYVIRDRSLAWGTRETVDGIVEAFDRLQDRYPDAPKLEVHDLSDRDGGFLAGHNSHQSGRDADIAYFHEHCSKGVCAFRRIGPSELDVERTWALIAPWLENDRVEAIFIDYKLQGALFRHARRQGATRKQLHEWFQYPRGRTFSVGALRHFPKHDDHMHVRFACHETDEQCR